MNSGLVGKCRLAEMLFINDEMRPTCQPFEGDESGAVYLRLFYEWIRQPR